MMRRTIIILAAMLTGCPPAVEILDCGGFVRAENETWFSCSYLTETSCMCDTRSEMEPHKAIVCVTEIGPDHPPVFHDYDWMKNPAPAKTGGQWAAMERVMQEHARVFSVQCDPTPVPAPADRTPKTGDSDPTWIVGAGPTSGAGDHIDTGQGGTLNEI